MFPEHPTFAFQPGGIFSFIHNQIEMAHKWDGWIVRQMIDRQMAEIWQMIDRWQTDR